jgi:hypothetical protein
MTTTARTAARLRFRKADDNEGAFTSCHGASHGTPHRYEVTEASRPGHEMTGYRVLGYVYKIEMHMIGATYTHWVAEAEIGTWPPPPGTTYHDTRAKAAEALR